ncbi:MAG: hypothetical protein M0R74_15165 [Dehalococcoidia bacterium]|nr:hypothetical protein [Dehalococcoidia bacterium]
MATVWERLRTRARAMLSKDHTSAKWVQPSNSVTRTIYDPLEADLRAPLEEPATAAPPPEVRPPAPEQVSAPEREHIAVEPAAPLAEPSPATTPVADASQLETPLPPEAEEVPAKEADEAPGRAA